MEPTTPHEKIRKTILWLARISAALVIAFILFFLLTHLSNQGNTDNHAIPTKDIFAFILFPIGTLLGLIVCFIRERTGSIIALMSMIILMIIRPDLVSNLLLLSLAFIPGVLFLIHSLLREEAKF
ncbi:DUF7670 domain-containing protein [Zhouia amylolytica]|uniref:DUF7670 domain-containing protein n=1 Tax=Zhouia amylolytica AD3 TaxID=1286632 RepID=W2UMC0_9FLAO|nr:hypothetical protein [Zhouia amylolytica]ETN94487.1 hypothetical protein P278_24300 [Zhouia amylolytica AD3]MCQ0110284.1 hypothetical protein [Zhouia amylolytica]